MRKSEYVLLVLLLVAGFGIRLWKIQNPIADWHSWRQADTAAVSRIYLEEEIDILRPRYYDISRSQTGIYNPEGLRYVEFPLYNVIHSLASKSFPSIGFEVWGRLITIFASLGSATLVYLLGSRYYGRWVGILASFFFLFLPYNVYYSRVILPEPLAVFGGLLSLWLFVKYVEEKSKVGLILSGIFLSLAALVKPFVLFYSIPMLYMLVSRFGLEVFRTKVAPYVFAAISLIPFFAWRIWINQYPQGIPGFGWLFNGDHIRFKPSFFKWIFVERIGSLILGGWGLIPFSFGLVSFDRKKLFNHFFLLGVILYVFIFATGNVRHDYYQIYLIPPISLLMASGVVEMWKKYPNLISKAFCLFAVAMAFLAGFYQVREYYQINHYEIVEAGEAARRLVPKGAKVIAPYNGDTAFLYQTARFGWPLVDRSIEDMIKKGAGYFVSVNFDKETNEVMDKYEVVEKTDSYVVVKLK